MNNNESIFLWESNCNNITSNICIFNNNNGIYFQRSHMNIIKHNNFSNNEIGIFLKGSNNNILNENIISFNSEKGLTIDSQSNFNNIYLNIIISNKIQATDLGDNYWNNSNHEGNYWSDYIGLDNGANGRVAGNGIGDTYIPHLGLDYYPFIEPYGWLIENRIIENQTGNISENDTEEENGHTSEDNGDQEGIDIIFSIRIIVILLVIILIIMILIKNRKKKSKITKEKKEK